MEHLRFIEKEMKIFNMPIQLIKLACCYFNF